MWWQQPVKSLNASAQQAALARQVELTKPPGSLGQLEHLVVRLAAMQGQSQPKMDKAWVSVFAADHGLAHAGVSAFPQAVTAQMVHNFVNGGAAISVLAAWHQADFEVVDVGVNAEFKPLPGLVMNKIAPGTANSLLTAAMTAAQCEQALLVGKQAAERAHGSGAHAFIGGEMGIGNTASASLIAAAMMRTDVAPLVGVGTGLDEAGLAHKISVLQQVWQRHQFVLSHGEPLAVLRAVGGFEIAALCGAYIRCAQLGLPVLIDGVITSAAALIAKAIQPSAQDWWLFSHLSAEPAHRQILQALDAQPMLQLDMRLGEASGAAIAWPLLQQACVLHQGMATFSEAAISQVSDKPREGETG